jgi:hypothetical protein
VSAPVLASRERAVAATNVLSALKLCEHRTAKKQKLEGIALLSAGGAVECDGAGWSQTYQNWHLYFLSGAREVFLVAGVDVADGGMTATLAPGIVSTAGCSTGSRGLPIRDVTSSGRDARWQTARAATQARLAVSGWVGSVGRSRKLCRLACRTMVEISCRLPLAQRALPWRFKV